MGVVVTAFHVLLSIALIVIILVQQGKGAEMGATFGGGGSNTLFGSRGAGNFLTKATAVGGALFMLTSVALTKFSVDYTGSSVVTPPAVSKEVPAKSATEGTPAAPGNQAAPEGAPAQKAPADKTAE